MELRKMTIDDYEAVYNLWINTPGMGLNNLDDSYEGISKYLVRNPNTCFIMKNENEIIGVILSGHDGRRGYIHHTAVKVSARNNGIGKKLVDKAIEALKSEGINKVAFVVFKTNEIGNAFWKKLGFEERNDLIYRNKVISNREMIKIEV